MKRLEFLRRDKKLSQRELGRLAGVSASYICNAESRGLILFPSQAQRLARELGWEGDASELFEEVKANEVH
ncbi:helix-turn-helix domain-containing protein [Arabiibacter massiliensis]|uniref:helix-turn-helix domain-containing protein n=1 Tax=Arabiibacter massiliensis TaxID=1870985 RepID=UPI00155ABCAE|nr:helix-turn-helix transcriptional regulator [Arabiibacter massiliensis]